jgi:short-subunit dehydrogenase
MPNILIVGATRGLGNSLAKTYASRGDTVYGTARSSKAPNDASIQWITGIDVATEAAGSTLSSTLSKTKDLSLDLVLITAGFFGKESFDEPSWDAEVKMYTTSAIAPVFLVHNLIKANLVKEGAKIIIVSSESGSITLRHKSEGGGNFGHHASKAASNMVGKLLSLDLLEKEIAVGIVHVRTSLLTKARVRS